MRQHGKNASKGVETPVHEMARTRYRDTQTTRFALVALTVRIIRQIQTLTF